MKKPSCVVALALLTACASSTPAPTTPTTSPTTTVTTTTPEGDRAAAVVAAADRDAADRALDAGRKPSEFLTFCGVQPGMAVAELGAGRGYTSELLARAVAPGGVVYGQNSRFILERFAEKEWAVRLAKPVSANIKRLDREFDDPFPAELAGTLDVVVDVLFYHDTVWLHVDRNKMNAAVFTALKPGGTYVIVDHSGNPGTGMSQTQTLHRIEEQAVVDEIKAAGFVVDATGDFLRNAADARDWNDSPSAAGDRRGTSDRFVVRFRKP